MKTTPLHSSHIAAGAVMAPFAGYDMPISYRGIEEEHRAVRSATGMFDVSHMGEVHITGPQAQAYVNHIFSGDVAPLAPGQVVYGMMLNERGGVVDDLLVYKRSAEDFFLVINASNIDKDVAWMQAHTDGFQAMVDDCSERWAELAIQGPGAEDVMLDVLGIDCRDMTFYTFRDIILPSGASAIVSRTGYTGEDGFELYAPADDIAAAWDTLASAGVEPCGLGCRDTLRFEAGLPLYGDELTDDITPLEAGLGMFAKTAAKPSFIGRDALVAQKEAGVPRKVVGLEIDGPAIARHGYAVLDMDGNAVGEVTTGYRSITMGRSLAMALVPAGLAAEGTRLQVQVRRNVFPATVVKKRFYTPKYKK